MQAIDPTANQQSEADSSGGSLACQGRFYRHLAGSTGPVPATTMNQVQGRRSETTGRALRFLRSPCIGTARTNREDCSNNNECTGESEVRPTNEPNGNDR